MRLATLLCLLLALLGAPAAASAVVAAKGGSRTGDRAAELQALATRAVELADRAPSQLYYRIAEDRDAEAFATLKEALAPLTDPGSARAAYGACAMFHGSAIQGSVVNWLARQSFKATQPAQQLAATEALVYFWQEAEDELLRILSSHSSRACRQLALAPLLPSLVAKGDRTACRLVIENGSTRGWKKTALLGALTRFTDREAETTMASVLREPGTARDLKVVLLDAFADRESDVALLAVERRLEDSDERVRLRAVQIVAQRKDPKDLARLKAVAFEGSPRYVLDAVLALAEAREGDESFLMELYAYTQSQDDTVRRAAAAALGRMPTRSALTLLHRLLRDDELQVRLEALDGIDRLRQSASIPKLIASLGDPRDLFTNEAARSLRLLTGLDHGVSRKRWEAWFDSEGATFQVPTLNEAQTLETERVARKRGGKGGTTASFYGIPIQGTRICFVLDTSGSMSDPAGGRRTTARRGSSTRMQVAKQELTSSLEHLLNGVRFNMITFSSDVRSYSKGLVDLTPQSRAKAVREIESWNAFGGTALYNGLRRALLDPEVEDVYLMTDGVPTEGDVVEEGAIRERVKEMLDGREVKIHGIAIGQSSSLLRRLAKDSGGAYTEIF